MKLDEKAWKLAFEYSFCFPGSQTEQEFNSKQEGFYHGYLEAKKSLYTEQDMIDFAEWIDENDLGKIGWKQWETIYPKREDVHIKANTTKELLEIWNNERQNT